MHERTFQHNSKKIDLLKTFKKRNPHRDICLEYLYEKKKGMSEIIRVSHLKKYFTKKGRFGKKSTVVRATDDVSFSLKKGEVLVLAGESGSGKSTIAKLILKAISADEGEIFFEGNLIDGQKKNIDKIRKNCQMIHQDPYDSINPRMKIADIISEPLEIHNMGDKKSRRERVLKVLQEVKLEPAKEIMEKYPHMVSGGQRQRIVLARALATRPKVIIADEPVSMLDVSVRAEMLELMLELQKNYEISFIYITHDLATARYFGQRIGILYLGKIVETGPIDQVLLGPKHPYTQALIDSISEPNPENVHKMKNIRIKEPSEENQEFFGCRFKARCPYEIKECQKEPELRSVKKEHLVACHVDID